MDTNSNCQQKYTVINKKLKTKLYHRIILIAILKAIRLFPKSTGLLAGKILCSFGIWVYIFHESYSGTCENTGAEGNHTFYDYIVTLIVYDNF